MNTAEKYRTELFEMIVANRGLFPGVANPEVALKGCSKEVKKAAIKKANKPRKAAKPIKKIRPSYH